MILVLWYSIEASVEVVNWRDRHGIKLEFIVSIDTI